MKKTDGYNLLKGKASNSAYKRTRGTVSPITKLAMQPVAVPVKPIPDKATDTGQSS